MPLLFTKKINETLLGVWQMSPSNAPKRIREKENVQQLVDCLCQETSTILHHESGKPYLENQRYHLTISHTQDYVAVALNPKEDIGIDIEKRADKVKRVRQKYVQAQEEANIDPTQEITHLLLYWCTKESIYKIIDNPKIILKDEVLIHPFIPQEEGWFTAEETKTANHQQFQVWYMMHKHFALTLAMPASDF
jgi:phosphopantetheinyl transferase (holo-ACP synthase)